MNALTWPETQIIFWTLLGVYWLSETLILQRMRAGSGDRTDDRGSLRLLGVLFSIGWAALFLLSFVSQGSFDSIAVIWVGLFMMGAGQLLRWWSVATLGRLFTVDVTIREGHRVIDSGPYRWVRHPAYTAILLFHLGAALAMDNAFTVIAMMVPGILGLLNRMRVEEQVLVSGFGDAYRGYMKRTKRLIPMVY